MGDHIKFPDDANMRGKPAPKLPGNKKTPYVPGPDQACIANIFCKQEFLTRTEALMLIQNISGALLIDERIAGSKETNKKYL